MACCILLAVILGGLLAVKKAGFASSKPEQTAQTWRLAKDKHA